MTPSTEPETPGGLRERKKARTKAAIQREAVRLFTAQGFDGTTVEQIAAAADVSPSTVFRYFPSKEAMIVDGGTGPSVAAAFRAQPADRTPIQAVRAALLETVSRLSPDEDAYRRDRQTLVLGVPALWTAGLGNIRDTQRMLAEVAAERTGREPGDPRVRSFAGAVLGILLDVWLRWAEDPELDAAAALDLGLDHLEHGLPL